jgi:hypothetical protein
LNDIFIIKVEYSVKSLDKFTHLTNNAIQEKCENFGCADIGAVYSYYCVLFYFFFIFFEIGNMYHIEQFEKYLINLEGFEIEEEKKKKLEKQKKEKERMERERMEKERMEKERMEKERLEKERLEKERLEKEKLEKERMEKEKNEIERGEEERIKKERLEKEKLEKENEEKSELGDSENQKSPVSIINNNNINNINDFNECNEKKTKIEEVENDINGLEKENRRDNSSPNDLSECSNVDDKKNNEEFPIILEECKSIEKNPSNSSSLEKNSILSNSEVNDNKTVNVVQIYNTLNTDMNSNNSEKGNKKSNSNNSVDNEKPLKFSKGKECNSDVINKIETKSDCVSSSSNNISRSEVTLESHDINSFIGNIENKSGKLLNTSTSSVLNSTLNVNPKNVKNSSPKFPFYTLWKSKCFPFIQQICVNSIKSARDGIADRKNSYEIYGFDFMIDEQMNPWLIEVFLFFPFFFFSFSFFFFFICFLLFQFFLFFLFFFFSFFFFYFYLFFFFFRLIVRHVWLIQLPLFQNSLRMLLNAQ